MRQKNQKRLSFSYGVLDYIALSPHGEETLVQIQLPPTFQKVECVGVCPATGWQPVLGQ